MRQFAVTAFVLACIGFFTAVAFDGHKAEICFASAAIAAVLMFLVEPFLN